MKVTMAVIQSAVTVDDNIILLGSTVLDDDMNDVPTVQYCRMMGGKH